MNKNFIISISPKSMPQSIKHAIHFEANKYQYTISGVDALIIKRYNQHRLVIMLYGDLLTHDLDYIYEIYKTNKLNINIKDIDGSYVLFILDTALDNLLVYSDRISSKKIFIHEDQSGIILTNDIKMIGLERLTVNRGSLLFYLANGYILEGSLFKQVYTLPYASKLELICGKAKKLSKYWEFQFEPSADMTEKAFQEEFIHLLDKSLKKRIKPNQKISIALSGGYDSAAILAALLSSGLQAEITVFHYAHKQSKKFSDKDIASRTAKNYNLKFVCLPFFPRGIMKSLSENSKYFQGIANICEELEAVTNFAHSKHGSILLFGEETFGTNDENLSNPCQALMANQIYPARNFGTNLHYLQDELQVYQKNATIIHSKLTQDMPEFESFYDMKHYFHFKYRICGVLTMCRDFFYGRYFRPVNPLLDYEILDLVQVMPAKMRKSKNLFKNAINIYYPEIFSIPRARYSNNITTTEYFDHIRMEFIECGYIFNDKNIMNDYIYLDQIQDALIKGLGRKQLYMSQYHDYIRKILRKTRINKDSVLYTRLSSGTSLDFINFLKRIIVLHEFFENK